MAISKIVIIGGGFGGVFTAKHLSRRMRDNVQIELINRDNYFTFQPLLPEVAAGVISAADAVVPLRAMLKGVTVRQAEVIGIDLVEKRIDYQQGSGRLDNFSHFDHLVLAMGQQVAVDRIPGMQAHGLTMKNLQDAFTLRNHVLNCLELADVTTRPELKKKYLTFVIVGGGFSGVETIGELEELISRSLRFYSNVSREEIRLVLVEFAGRILQEMPTELASYTARKLVLRGIEIMLNTALSSVTVNDVTFSNGEVAPAATVVATVGNGPSPLLGQLPLELSRGKIAVSRDLRAKGHQNIWAVGDAAAIPLSENPDAYAPPTAQFAVREAKVLANNIAATLQGKVTKPFNYKSKGSLASIGVQKGVASIFGFRVKGFPAWLLWRWYYLSFLPNVFSKIRVLTNWILDSSIPRNTVRLPPRVEQGTKVVHYRAGEIIFSSGMHYDGLYVVLEGRVQIEVEGKQWTVEPGGFFGEQTILAGIRARGVSKTLEDSKLLVLGKKDFLALREASPDVKKLFSIV